MAVLHGITEVCSSQLSISGLISDMSLPVSVVIWQLLPSTIPGVTSPSPGPPADTFLKALSRALPDFALHRGVARILSMGGGGGGGLTVCAKHAKTFRFGHTH